MLSNRVRSAVWTFSRQGCLFRFAKIIEVFLVPTCQLFLGSRILQFANKFSLSKNWHYYSFGTWLLLGKFVIFSAVYTRTNDSCRQGNLVNEKLPVCRAYRALCKPINSGAGAGHISDLLNKRHFCQHGREMPREDCEFSLC